MKSFSLLTIILLCVALLLVDITAFYWLQSIMHFVDSVIFKTLLYTMFWLFTVGLVVSILVLKITLDAISPVRKQLLISRFYGLGVLSFVPKLVFIIVISILYFTNFLFSENKSLIIIPIIGVLSGFLPFFVILHGVFKAIYKFKVYHHTIESKRLPKSFDGLTIVQISDLHLGSFNYAYKKLESAIEKINNLKPDYIVITGDLVNNYAWELRGWDSVFKKLEAKKGKYAILGNHDYGDYSEWETPELKQENFEAIQHFFKTINFKLLLNASEVISKDTEKIAIIGIENWGKPAFKEYGDLKKAMANIENIPFKILLSHDPTHWPEEVIDKTDITLTLAGHTHGMQAAFQYKNLQWSPIKYKFKHWAGLYQHKSQYLYVNRGLGWLGFPARIGMRPEITFIALKTKT
ncbi:metallophosphoesterase [Bizionia gelidisalsuginis]|uniref:Metallophosphoesterase n=1 Tax=Bizionia gelidisalsuginis TaxID=291188 RepID=A0ABY3M7L9_9FLAO|nr:metallophosphoesterase [Bizionia gelidisalsuginis]TYC09181.1 metallophosphoesterase [Bizionia gelidisalsuginis]